MIYKIALSRAEPINITDKMIVMINRPFSAPRFFVATESDPPKAEPKPAPLLCIKTTIMSRMAEIKTIVFVNIMVEVYQKTKKLSTLLKIGTILKIAWYFKVVNF